MAKIVSDRSGNLRKGVFYVFDLMYEDVPYGNPTPEWIIAPRTPTNDALIDADKPYYLHVDDHPRDSECVEIKDCLANPNHVTLCYHKALAVSLAGDSRLAPFIPTSTGRFIVVSKLLRARLDALKIKGARLDAITIDDNPLDLKEVALWNFQFLGRIRKRPPKFLDTVNLCPHCGLG